jgi:two-component system nitrogen regulation response regulator GlnG
MEFTHMDIPPQILVIDDDRDMRWALRTILESIGLSVAEANAGPAGLEIAARGRPAAVLLDMRIPGLSGHEVLTHLRARHPALPIIVITGYGTIQGAVSTIQAGAFDYMLKPFDNDTVISTVRRAIALRGSEPDLPYGNLKEMITELMGCSAAIQGLIAKIETVINTDYSVVVGGETGTGKELVAQALHRYGPRRTRPFVVLDCGTISEALVASELFGHERGAYTDAHERRRGRLEVAASGGTIFMDEIGNLCTAGQRALLRALEERVIYRIGSTTPIPLDMRLITATNDILVDDDEASAFRPDLFYRLSEFIIVAPPLRERPEDVEFLASRFLRQSQREHQTYAREFTPDALDLLQNYPWPGNVRQLRNVVRRVSLMASSEVTAAHITECMPQRSSRTTCTGSRASPPPPTPLRSLVEHQVQQLERDAILDALTQAGGNKAMAARRLRINYKTFRLKLKAAEQHASVGHDIVGA